MVIGVGYPTPRSNKLSDMAIGQAGDVTNSRNSFYSREILFWNDGNSKICEKNLYLHWKNPKDKKLLEGFIQ